MWGCKIIYTVYNKNVLLIVGSSKIFCEGKKMSKHSKNGGTTTGVYFSNELLSKNDKKLPSKPQPKSSEKPLPKQLSSEEKQKIMLYLM